jgi:hypothetical protein
LGRAMKIDAPRGLEGKSADWRGRLKIIAFA